MPEFYQLANKSTEFITKAIHEDIQDITNVAMPVKELHSALLRLPWAIRALAQRGFKITIVIEKEPLTLGED